MSVSAWAAAFDVVRELRWWIAAPSSGVSVPAASPGRGELDLQRRFRKYRA